MSARPIDAYTLCELKDGLTKPAKRRRARSWYVYPDEFRELRRSSAYFALTLLLFGVLSVELGQHLCALLSQARHQRLSLRNVPLPLKLAVTDVTHQQQRSSRNNAQRNP